MPRLSSRLHWLSTLTLTSALLACSDDAENPQGANAGTSSGSSGTSGQSGTAGASGKGGTAGTAGSAGSAGTAGSSGSSGQAGAVGTTGGAAGTDGGAAGTTGGVAGTTAGVAGTTSGAAGTDGGAGGTAGANVGGTAGTTGGAAGGGAGGAAGGAGGAAGGGAGVGGSGGSSAELTCLPASDHASVLTLEASSPFCVVRVHKTSLASFGFSTQVTWGQHGGPLTTDTTSGASVRRWTPGTDVHAALDATDKVVTVPNLPPSPAMVFFGPAVDVPALGLTTLSYTTTDANSSGELLAFDTDLTTLKSRTPVNGFYASGVLPASLDVPTKARMLFTALSPITTAATTTNSGGLYALDICDATTLLKDGCGSSFKKATWASASGPVAVDTDGNSFAALSTFGGNQEVRGFTSLESASSTTATGHSVLINTDFSTSLAASAPLPNGQGYVVVQTGDSATFLAKTALVYSYSVGVAGLTTTAIAQGGFQATEAGANVTVFGAPDGTIWVAVDGTDAGYFVALKRT